MILNEHFSEFINVLNKYNVKYVMVGGQAVIFEGYSRTTGVELHLKKYMHQVKFIMMEIFK